ncbi:hypothetical protein DRQ36_06310 [bacterium]|nr:MAG: hypothetical protein DRQ36_06310 [bacterium]
MEVIKLRIWFFEVEDFLKANWSSDNPDHVCDMVNEFVQEYYKKNYSDCKTPRPLTTRRVVEKAYLLKLISHNEKVNILRRNQGLTLKPQNRIWTKETDSIVQKMWGKATPSEIASEVNLCIRNHFKGNSNKTCSIIQTGRVGKGVVYRAHKLKLITEIEREKILKNLGKNNRKNAKFQKIFEKRFCSETRIVKFAVQKNA